MRPVLVIQNDVGNRHSPTVIAAAVTSQICKARLPTHVELGGADGLDRPSVVLLEQLRTIDKRRLHSRLGRLCPEALRRVDVALAISVGLRRP